MVKRFGIVSPLGSSLVELPSMSLTTSLVSEPHYASDDTYAERELEQEFSIHGACAEREREQEF